MLESAIFFSIELQFFSWDDLMIMHPNDLLARCVESITDLKHVGREHDDSGYQYNGSLKRNV